MIVWGGAAGWLEFVGLVGFAVTNVAAVFVALWWALGRPDEDPAPRPVLERGRMSAAGVPYVPGPAQDHERAELPVTIS